MAHIRKENKAPSMRDYTIYVILSPFSEKKFIVNKTLAGRLYKTYSEHYNLRVTKTKELFLEARNKNLLPPLYKLESIFTTEREAFRRCIAWTKYFIEQGYEQVVQDALGNYADDLLPEVERYFKQIKQDSIEDILLPAGGEFPEYGSLDKRNGTNPTVTIKVDTEDYAKLKEAAKRNEMSVTAYCKQMALTGKIVKADLSFIGNYTDMFTESKLLLRQILYSIYTTGKYNPADLKNIQLCIDNLTEIQKLVSEESINLIRALRE